MRQRPKITGANAGKRPGFAENTRVGRSPRSGVAQFHRWLRHEVAIGTAWRSNPDQALRVAAGIPRKHAPDGQPRKLSGLLPGVWSLPGNVSNLVASNRERARIGGQGQN